MTGEVNVWESRVDKQNIYIFFYLEKADCDNKLCKNGHKKC